MTGVAVGRRVPGQGGARGAAWPARQPTANVSAAFAGVLVDGYGAGWSVCVGALLSGSPSCCGAWRGRGGARACGRTHSLQRSACDYFQQRAHPHICRSSSADVMRRGRCKQAGHRTRIAQTHASCQRPLWLVFACIRRWQVIRLVAWGCRDVLTYCCPCWANLCFCFTVCAPSLSVSCGEMAPGESR